MDAMAWVAGGAAVALVPAAAMMGDCRAAWRRFGLLAAGLAVILISLYVVSELWPGKVTDSLSPVVAIGAMFGPGGVPWRARFGVALGTIAMSILISAWLSLG